MERPEKVYYYNPESFPNDKPNGEVFVENFVDFSSTSNDEIPYPEIVKFSDIWFDNGVKGPDYLPDLWSMKDCRIEKNLEFINTKTFDSDYSVKTRAIHSICLENIEITGDLIFENCNLKALLEISNLKSLQSIKFFNCKINDIILSDLDANELFFSDCKFNSISIIGQKNGALKFFNSHISNNVLVSQVNGAQIIFDEVCVDGRTLLEQINLSDSLKIEGCKFNYDLVLDNIRSKVFHLEDNTYERRMLVSFGLVDYKKLKIVENDLVEIDEIIIEGGVYKYGGSLSLDDQHINKLNLIVKKGFQNIFNISDGVINEFNITGENEGGGIFLEDLEVRDFKISYYQNFGQMTVSHLFSPETKESPTSSFLIEESDLGNLHLIDVDFKEFNEIEIDSSFLQNIQFSNVDWFGVEEFNKTAKNPIDFAEKREVMRQLKHAAEKQGDRAQALKFKAREYSLYEKVIDADILDGNSIKKKSKAQKKELSRLKAERYSLWIGRLTNDLGQNWVKPLKQIFIITAIFYPFFIIAASSEYTWWPFGNELAIKDVLSLMWQELGVLPQLFNPARNASTAFNKELSGIFYYWDSLHRIVLTFYIFQIISAFRKFFK